MILTHTSVPSVFLTLCVLQYLFSLFSSLLLTPPPPSCMLSQEASHTHTHHTTPYQVFQNTGDPVLRLHKEQGESAILLLTCFFQQNRGVASRPGSACCPDPAVENSETHSPWLSGCTSAQAPVQQAYSDRQERSGFPPTACN